MKAIIVHTASSRSSAHDDSQDRARAALTLHHELYGGSREPGASKTARGASQ